MRLLRTHTFLLVRRIVLLYVVLALCRVVFYICNRQLIGALPVGEWWPLLCGALKFDTVSILYINALYILMALVPLHVRERAWWQRMMFWYYAVANALAVALNMADAIYFRYTQKRFTADEIFFADNDNSLQLVLKFAAENWAVVAAGAVIIGLLVWGYRRRTEPEVLFAGAWYYLTSLVMLLAGTALTIGGIRGGFTKMTRPITLSNATLYTSDNARATFILSNPFCVLRTAGSSSAISYEHYFDEATLDNIFSPIHRPARRIPVPAADSTTLAAADTLRLSADTTATAAGSMAGRNVVIFIMESFSAEHSARLRPDLYEDKEQKGYTPFLDSLMGCGYTFNRMYANGKRSIQALPAVWSSIPSFKTPFVLMPQSLAPTYPLPAILADEGYRTLFFCGSDRGSMGFEAYANAAGITESYSREDYEKEHGRDDFDGYWGIWDEEFMQYMGEVLGRTQQPFFASIFTLSSHHPFVIPARYEGQFPDGLTKNHRCVAYVDNAFRLFFERFGSQEWFRKTLFVFVADHVSSEKFSEEFRHSPADYQIFGFMYAPDSRLQGEYAHVASQIDIMPTLLGLLGYDRSYFAFGRDIFNEPTDTPAAVNYDNNIYQAITDNYLVRFDEKDVRDIYAVDDVRHERNLAGEVAVPATEQYLKALIQSYYTHVENKNYTVNDPLPQGSYHRQADH